MFVRVDVLYCCRPLCILGAEAGTGSLVPGYVVFATHHLSASLPMLMYSIYCTVGALQTYSSASILEAVPGTNVYRTRTWYDYILGSLVFPPENLSASPLLIGYIRHTEHVSSVNQ